MACPLNIEVCISDRFFAVPYIQIQTQRDVGQAPVRNLIMYVPTEEDVHFVDKSYFKNIFTSVSVEKQERVDLADSRAPRKNDNAVVVYWNPILPIAEVGVGVTHVYSILLTDNLFLCKTMVVDSNTPMCPVQMLTRSIASKFIPIEGENPLAHFNTMSDNANNDFLICFMRETPRSVRLLNIKRILTIFEFRSVPARFAFQMNDAELQQLYIQLKNEVVRRLIKGDNSSQCPYLNVPSLRYIKSAQKLLMIPDSAHIVIDLVAAFQILVLPYQIVPDILVKLNSLDRDRRVRLYCKNDSYAITSKGPVPNNMPDENLYQFDYSEINTPVHLNKVRDALYEQCKMSNLTVASTKYNYFF
uniref:ODV-Ec43 n=1 Tax=Ophiusa disjungens nucleopolyhedrovirus TaxID=521523 RepID=B2MUD3_9ABAC|nr:ODV-Ec43 [Ophiusa disjungens nucleopolyhedrovirus]